ncbi:PAS domain-containing protein [Kamptonema formosum]|uniref:PAS domain-containing protein n=1 Tax=Kamptonema formosum TaxID=331992 RepID=UPI0003448CAE|nr:PAS domain-containing protein [Oscillatoria sp. PCC 10802]
MEPAELIATINSLLRLRQVEEGARVAAQQWQTTFDAICDGVCLLDCEGKILQCNRAMAELLNLPVGDILRRSYYSSPVNLGCPDARILDFGLGIGVPLNPNPKSLNPLIP